MRYFRKSVKADCELILTRFQQTESVRFEVFSQIWKDMKFDEIFYGTGKHESRMFGRLVLDTAYEFLHPPFTFQIRVGGLYLLYALFHCQTASPPEKIRLALKDWDEVLKFEKESLAAYHYDVVYILRRLMHNKAFVYTAMPRLLTFERKVIYKHPQVCKRFLEKPSAPQILINNDLLEELSNVDSLYKSLKSTVCPASDSSLNLVHQNLIQSMHGTVLNFYKWQQDQDRSSLDDVQEQGTSVKQESLTRANLLASIKSRAYGEAAEMSRSRRHRVVEVDHETKRESGPAPLSRYQKRKLKSLKYRVRNIIGDMSGDFWKEGTSGTSFSQLTPSISGEKPPRTFKKFKFKMDMD